MKQSDPKDVKKLSSYRCLLIFKKRNYKYLYNYRETSMINPQTMRKEHKQSKSSTTISNM